MGEWDVFAFGYGVVMKVLFASLMLLCPLLVLGTEYHAVQVVQYVSCYDGDTVTVNVPAWPAIVGDRIGVRVFGIDTPEMRDSRPEIRVLAVRARNFVRALLSAASVVELRHVMRDKYFRLLGEVWADGVSLGQMLLSLGLARPYDGGTKLPW